MNKVKSLIAVLATAALTLVAPNIKAADSYSPAAGVDGDTVQVYKQSATQAGVQSNPLSYRRAIGYAGAATNAPTAAGTNFVVRPLAPFQYITCSSNVNFVSTNIPGTSTTAWRTTYFVDPNGGDRTITIPSWWKTNPTTGNFYFTTLTNGTYGLYHISGYGTNVSLRFELTR